MQNLLTFHALSQNGYQEVDVFLYKRADYAVSSGLDISPLHTNYDDFEEVRGFKS